MVSQLCTRSKKDESYPRINLAEFIFLRRASVAWFACAANTSYITREEVASCAMSVIN